MQITSTFDIDLCKQGSPQRIWVMQADANTRLVEIHLFDNGAAWTIPEGVGVAFGYQKPDGTAGLYDRLPDGTAALAVEENTVTLILAPQVLTAPGLVRAVITLSNADLHQLSTFPFEIVVRENPVAGKIVSENYCYCTNLDAINKALGDISGLKVGKDIVSAINLLVEAGERDLTGYATQQWVQDGYQPKGSYLTEHQDISGKLDADKLPEAINQALTKAKTSGEFDGKDGKNGLDGRDGSNGKTPVKGEDYYTEADKTEMVNAVIAALPIYNGEVESV